MPSIHVSYVTYETLPELRCHDILLLLDLQTLPNITTETLSAGGRKVCSQDRGSD